MAQPSIIEAIDTDPFGEEAIGHARARRLTTDEQRRAVQGELAQLREEGYVVLPGVLEGDRLAEVRSFVRQLHAETPTGTNSFAGVRTKRRFNLLAETRCLDTLVADPTVLALVEELLEDQVQLSIASTIDLGPGGEAQALHRDDSYYPIPHPHMALAVNVMFALDEFTEANGATRFVAGSHRWADGRQARPDEVQVAEMPAGAAFMWHGSLLHGGGANRTEGWRCGLTLLYCRAWLRQQENQYLGLDPAVVAGFDRPLQRLLGYSMFGATLGNVEGADPKHWLAGHRSA